MSGCIERYGALVWSLARRMSTSQADAEDAVQDVFIALWRNAGRFDPQIAAETTFVTMIARRRLIDRSRRRESRPSTRPLQDAAAMTTASDADPMEVEEEVERATEALAALRPEQREVLRMVVVDGMTHREAAEKTGMPLGTVKAHARRGLMKVREMLTPSRVEAGRL